MPSKKNTNHNGHITIEGFAMMMKKDGKPVKVAATIRTQLKVATRGLDLDKVLKRPLVIELKPFVE